LQGKWKIAKILARVKIIIRENACGTEHDEDRILFTGANVVSAW